VERLQRIIYVSALQQNNEDANWEAMQKNPRISLLPFEMLVCPPDSSHCGYGGVDTSQEAYNDPSPLAIIGEQCTKKNRWECTFPGPMNYGPDSPAIWLPEEDLLNDPTLVRKVWPVPHPQILHLAMLLLKHRTT